MLAQQLLNGIVVGGVYAIFAVGLTLVFGVHKILNLAHGGIFMAGAFVAVFAVRADVPFVLALLLAAVFGGLLSVLIEFVAFRPLRRHNEQEFGAIVSSIGANLVIVTVAQQLSQTQVMRFPFDTFPIVVFHVFDLRVSLLQLFITGSAAVLVIALTAYLYGSSFGREVRAVAGNPRAALLAGINPEMVYFQTFFLAGALAAAAGVLVGLAFNSIHFLMGEPYLLRGFIVVILGGLGSISGALIAGLLFGLLQTLTTAYLPTQLGDTVVFSMLFLILLLCPSGLLGREPVGSFRTAR